MNLQQILDQSPDIPGYGGGKWAMYSVNCCWWTSFPEDLGSTADFMPGKLKIHSIGGRTIETDLTAIPCCPHCGSVLMQAPLEKFVEAAQANPDHYGDFGIDAFVQAHSRVSQKVCHRSWTEYNEDIRRKFLPPAPPPTYA